MRHTSNNPKRSQFGPVTPTQQFMRNRRDVSRFANTGRVIGPIRVHET